jgi:predicted CXXCH cytochrome family protein
VLTVALGAAGASGAYALRLARAERQASVDAVTSGIPHVGLERDGFVSSDTCRTCHPEHYTTWHETFHRTMTQPASPDIVVGDFNGVRVSHEGWTCRFYRRGTEFWVSMVDPEWAMEVIASGADPRLNPNPQRGEYRVVMTTGLHHQQVYWVAGSVGRRLWAVPWTWLTRDQRWVPRDDTFLRPPDAPWVPQMWNGACINCHSVAGEPIAARQGDFDTRVAELGIACEACHGPAEEHIRVNAMPWRRHENRDDDEPDPTIINPERLSPERSSEVCGRCHSVAMIRKSPYDNGLRYRAGDDLDVTRRVVKFGRRNVSEKDAEERAKFEAWVHDWDPSYLEGRFWSDGMVRVSGRDFSGMHESACYWGGELSCLSCHSMHHADPVDQLSRDMDSDAACLQCHESFADDIAAHTHHDVGSSGSACYNCHMPHTAYGLMKAIRSHLIDSPSAAVTLETGRPDACSLCHLDKSLAWTAQYLNEWYDQPIPSMAPTFSSVAHGPLTALRGDAGQRALIAWHLGWSPAQGASGAAWMAPYLAVLLDDPYSVVRYLAYHSIRTLPGFEDFEYDFVARPERRGSVREAVLERWRRSMGGAETFSPETLIGQDGTLAIDRIRALLMERDNRPMDLKE